MLLKLTRIARIITRWIKQPNYGIDREDSLARVESFQVCKRCASYCGFAYLDDIIAGFHHGFSTNYLSQNLKILKSWDVGCHASWLWPKLFSCLMLHLFAQHPSHRCAHLRALDFKPPRCKGKHMDQRARGHFFNSAGGAMYCLSAASH